MAVSVATLFMGLIILRIAQMRVTMIDVPIWFPVPTATLRSKGEVEGGQKKSPCKSFQPVSSCESS
eukprot:1862771-Ditylum_brightwellii.AAC.1